MIVLSRIWSTAVALGFLAATLAATPAAADDVQAVSTGGKVDLTMCHQHMMLYSTCYLYHHIKVPPQIAIGDKVRLHYGSNPKRYDFPIARIVRDGDTCTVFSQLTETKDVEKLEVASCGDAPAAQ
jgi:hypothetical protein